MFSRKCISVMLSVTLCMPFVGITMAYAEEDELSTLGLDPEIQQMIASVEEAAPGTFREDSVIVTVSQVAPQAELQAYAKSFNVSECVPLSEDGESSSTLMVSLPDNLTVAQAIENYSKVPGVISVQPNYLYRLVGAVPEDTIDEGTVEQSETNDSPVVVASNPDELEVNDPYANASSTSAGVTNQWYLRSVNAQKAWLDTTCMGNATIVVMDTGILFEHEDLVNVIDADLARQVTYDDSGKIVCLPYSESERSSDYGHGTHVAGIAAAEANNGVGFAGVSYNATIVPYKVFFDYYDEETLSWEVCTDDAVLLRAYQSIFEMADMDSNNQGSDDPHVINLSLGGSTRDAAFEAAINTARDKYDILTVCAAGNDATSAASYPSDYEACTSVMSVNSADSRSDFSDYGPAKDITAPGSSIWAPYVGYETAKACLNGTSMAAPIVSACAALMWAKDPSLTVREVQEIMYETATDLGTEGFDNYYGWGKVDIYQALKEVDGSVRASADAFTYTGRTSSTLNSVIVTLPSGEYLTYEQDYTLEFFDAKGTKIETPVNAGSYTVVIKGAGDFEGTFEKKRTLVIEARDISSPRIEVQPIPDQRFTGQAINPALSIAFNDANLVDGGDYSVSYKNNIDMGIATASVQGLGNYCGTINLSFNIRLGSELAEIKSIEVHNTATDSLSQFFVSVVDTNGVTLVEGQDYTIGFTDAYGATIETPSAAGSYTLRVTGTGPYAGVPDRTINFLVRDSHAETVERIHDAQGATASDTAAVVSRTACDNSEWVIIARNDDFADAMSATGLAGALNAPILLTDRTELSLATAKEVERLGASHAYIIGGEGALSKKVETDLKNVGLNDVSRLFGDAAFDTSVRCAEQLAEIKGDRGAFDKVIVATSTSFQDALSMSSFAYAYQVPILLQTGGASSADRKLTSEALALINDTYKDATIYVPGGTGAVSWASAEGVFGASRIVRLTEGQDGYDTSNAIAKYMVDQQFLTDEVVTIACGATKAHGVDALAGSVLAGKSCGVVLLANANDKMEPISLAAIDGFLTGKVKDVKKVYVLGGTYVMPQPFMDSIEQLLSV